MKIRISNTLTISETDELPKGGIHVNTFEILYITKGTAKFHWADHCCETVAPAIFLVSPSTPHMVESIGKEISTFFLEITEMNDHFFTTSIVDSWNMMQSQEPTASSAYFHTAIQHSLDFICQLIHTYEAMQHENLQQICLLEVQKIFKLIAYILIYTSNQAHSPDERKWSTHETIDILKNYMEWRYIDDITLKMLSQMVNFNPSYLVRIFKERTQYTPIEYLQLLRMNAAESYLTRTNLPLQKIIEKTGFNSVHYFCRLFKKKYGESPIQWRKNNVRELLPCT
ncbi:helix-turn-helix transcriptional regulator [Paenibacillus eucommiae]|uniref:YesN/AraC family two-component response regulator n=1 Tax=Paenibacillus eucommiae TaxID=1355755 RepID=A0ABS4IXZ9_9BACL|nr:AraC family transcriptional regulator [Paenibacillus eucommiae]MBP1992457.1 YesN/AraC family two-component response regulator [Paenibacillus eucommiae]